MRALRRAANGIARQRGVLGHPAIVGVARCIEYYPIGQVIVGASQIRRIHQHRVDDQRHGFVVGTHLEAHLLFSQKHIASFHCVALALALLVGHRLALANLGAAHRQNQIPGRVDAQLIRSVELQPDLARLGLRPNNEVVFQLLAGTVIG